jgi:DnaJ-class molecular chaperone
MKKFLGIIIKLVSCQRCRGMGVTDNGDDTVECKTCEGKGYIK